MGYPRENNAFSSQLTLWILRWEYSKPIFLERKTIQVFPYLLTERSKSKHASRPEIGSFFFHRSLQIVHRRLDGSIDFNRTWEQYQRGFGFLGTEFWLGNDKLSYWTNQKRVELQIDMVNSEGSSFSITYDSFLISDEWSGYSLSSVGSYNGKVGMYKTL